MKSSRIKTYTVAVAMLIALTGLLGCSRSGGRAQPEVGASGLRIACASPAIVELVYALGCGDRVVGVSDFTRFPEEARAVPRIGGWMSPNRERLLSLRPDLIISQGKNDKLTSFCSIHGIRLVATPLDTLDDFFAAVETIADTLGVQQKGAKLIQRMTARFEELRARGTLDAPPRVALLLGRASGNMTGLTAVGANTFVSELLHIAGGINIFEDAHGLYPQVSRESLLARKPRFVIELHPGAVSSNTIARAETDWSTWAQLMDVHNGGIVCLTNDFILIPGPRMVQTAELFADLLHPERDRP